MRKIKTTIVNLHNEIMIDRTDIFQNQEQYRQWITSFELGMQKGMSTGGKIPVVFGKELLSRCYVKFEELEMTEAEIKEYSKGLQ
jgi:hypothetical protein